MSITKKIFFILGSLLLAFGFSEAQNLVPNPSFEDTVNCPTSISQLYNTQFWVNPTQCTPDYYNACSTANGNCVHVPNNCWGYQLARSGVAYTGIYTFAKTYPNNSREYIQATLSNTLTANRKYFVSFYVSLSDGVQYAISSIGAYFSSTPITGTGCNILNYVPQIKNKSSNILSDKTNWMLIADTLYADGTEKYITIGNFKKDSLSDTLFLGNIGGGNVAYYYIDDVSVIDVNSLGVGQNKNNGQINIFPSPANNSITITCSLQLSSLQLIDMLGNVITTKELKNREETIDVSAISNGIYFIKLFSSQNNLLESKKVIVQH